MLRVRPGAGVVGCRSETIALQLGADEARAQPRDLVLEVHLAGLLERQQVGQLGNLRVETNERRVLSGHFLGQEELHHDEHGEQEDDAEDERR